MKEKRELQRFLAQNLVNYKLPERIYTDDKANRQAFAFIQKVCDDLLSSHKILLTEKNIEALIKVAKKARSENRQRRFAFATGVLSARRLLTQEIFNAICENESRLECLSSNETLRSFFFELARLDLLTQANIKKLIDNLDKAAKENDSVLLSSTSPSSTYTSVRQYHPDYEKDLCDWLADKQTLAQDDFDFMMRSKKVHQPGAYIQKLTALRLNTPENYQAMMDANFSFDSLYSTDFPTTQLLFNANILARCKVKLSDLESRIAFYAQDSQSEDLTGAYNEIHRHALSLQRELLALHNTPEVQENPCKFFHILTVVTKALSVPEGHLIPSKADIEELKALGAEVKGHPRPAWQKAGQIMMILGGVIALAVGIILTTACIANPLGIGLAATGIVGGITALVGLGLFGGGKLRTGMSRDVVKLADNLEVLYQPAAVN